jgi:hypothetical protein
MTSGRAGVPHLRRCDAAILPPSRSARKSGGGSACECHGVSPAVGPVTFARRPPPASGRMTAAVWLLGARPIAEGGRRGTGVAAARPGGSPPEGGTMPPDGGRMGGGADALPFGGWGAGGVARSTVLAAAGALTGGRQHTEVRGKRHGCRPDNDRPAVANRRSTADEPRSREEDAPDCSRLPRGSWGLGWSEQRQPVEGGAGGRGLRGLRSARAATGQASAGMPWSERAVTTPSGWDVGAAESSAVAAPCGRAALRRPHARGAAGRSGSAATPAPAPGGGAGQDAARGCGGRATARESHVSRAGESGDELGGQGCPFLGASPSLRLGGRRGPFLRLRLGTPRPFAFRGRCGRVFSSPGAASALFSLFGPSRGHGGRGVVLPLLEFSLN